MYILTKNSNYLKVKKRLQNKETFRNAYNLVSILTASLNCIQAQEKIAQEQIESALLK